MAQAMQMSMPLASGQSYGIAQPGLEYYQGFGQAVSGGHLSIAQPLSMGQPLSGQISGVTGYATHLQTEMVPMQVQQMQTVMVQEPVVEMVPMQQVQPMIEMVAVPVQTYSPPAPPQSPPLKKREEERATSEDKYERSQAVEDEIEYQYILVERPTMVPRIVEKEEENIVFQTQHVPVEKIIQKFKDVRVEVPVEVYVKKEKIVEFPVEVPKVVEVEKVIYKDRVVYQDRVMYQDRMVEVPVERIIKEEVVQEQKRLVEIPVERITYKDIEVPVEVDRYVQVPVEVIRQVEVIREIPHEVVRDVEKIKEVYRDIPVEIVREQIIEKEIPVHQPIERLVEVPVETTVYKDRVQVQDRVKEVAVGRGILVEPERERATRIVERAAPVQYERAQYVERGAATQYVERAAPAQYVERSAPGQYVERSAPAQYVERSAPAQYVERSAPVQYVERAAPTQYLERAATYGVPTIVYSDRERERERAGMAGRTYVNSGSHVTGATYSSGTVATTPQQPKSGGSTVEIMS